MDKNPAVMRVLSLFDGMSCGQIALRRSGIRASKYYASEIDKHALLTVSKTFTDTIQLGDVRKLDARRLKVDLILGGSPCQSFSRGGKRTGFEDPRGMLFWHFLRVLKEVRQHNPDVLFLLENVKMKDDDRKVITNALGVSPIEIDSALVSAQRRIRLYWTNIPDVKVPADRGVTLDSVIDCTFMTNKAVVLGRRLNSDGVRKDYDKSIPFRQYLEVKASGTDKSNTLTSFDKNNVLSYLPAGRYSDPYGLNRDKWRHYTVKECCRLQTVDDDHFDGIDISDYQKKKMLGNGWTIDVISHILNYI